MNHTRYLEIRSDREHPHQQSSLIPSLGKIPAILLLALNLAACGSNSHSTSASQQPTVVEGELGSGESTQSGSQFLLDPIPDLKNTESTGETQYQVTVHGADASRLAFSIIVADENVVSARLDTQRVLHLTPLTKGRTTVSISAMYGRLLATQSFHYETDEFQIKQDLTIESENLDTTAIRISNSSTHDINFRLEHNGFREFLSAAEAVNTVQSMAPEFSGETFARKLWRFVRDRVYHYGSLSTATWANDAPLVLNSIGFGFCHQVAATYVEIARAAGYQARIWGLTGHVVPEIYIDDKWEMYDPDLAVYYHDRSGNIASVSTLTADPELITNPVDPIFDPTLEPAAYAATLAEIYTSTSDNFDGEDFIPTKDAIIDPIRLPPGSSLEYPGHWTDAPTALAGNSSEQVPFYAQASMTIPSGYTGEIRTPWLAWDIQGDADIVLTDGQQTYAAGSASLRYALQAGASSTSRVSIAKSRSDVRIVFLINALMYLPTASTSLSVYSVVPQGLSITQESISPDIAVEATSADDFRKPRAAPIL